MSHLLPVSTWFQARKKHKCRGSIGSPPLPDRQYTIHPRSHALSPFAQRIRAVYNLRRPPRHRQQDLFIRDSVHRSPARARASRFDGRRLDVHASPVRPGGQFIRAVAHVAHGDGTARAGRLAELHRARWIVERSSADRRRKGSALTVTRPLVDFARPARAPRRETFSQFVLALTV